MSAAITLNQLIQPDFHDLFVTDAEHVPEDIHKLQTILQAKSALPQWQLIQQEMSQQLMGLLNISLDTILSRAWGKNEKVQAVIQKQKETGSEELAVIPLHEHKIRSDHRPKLNIFLDGEKISEIPLTVRVVLKLHDVILKVQHGSIQSVIGGCVEGLAVIYHYQHKLKEQLIDRFELSECMRGRQGGCPEHELVEQQAMLWTQAKQDEQPSELFSPTTNIAKLGAQGDTLWRNMLFLLYGLGLAFAGIALVIYFRG
jgi:hypothetical protein